MNNYQFEAGGGAAIGFATSNRFAKLKVSEYRLELNGGLIGKVVFLPGDVDTIELDRSGFGMRTGIRITHHVSGYRKKIIFYPAGIAGHVLEEIRATGFLMNKGSMPYGVREEAEVLQSGGSFPIKTPAIIAIVVIWNAFCLYGSRSIFLKGQPTPENFTKGAVGATGFMILTCLLLLISPYVRSIVMKEGHEIKDIRNTLFFVVAICAFIMLGNLILP